MKKYFNLMEYSSDERFKKTKCIEGEHEFIAKKFPLNNRSGWHEDECKKCGIIIGYDTSD